MTDVVDQTRERLVGALFASWEDHDVAELVRLMRKFADAVGRGDRDKESRDAADRALASRPRLRR